MATLTSLLNDGGWTPEARRATAFDKMSPEGGLIRRRGRVMCHTNFNDGTLQGWRQHYDGFQPRPAIGLTSYPVREGSHAMMIPTGDIPYDAAHKSNFSGTFKNLSQYRPNGLISVSGWTTINSGMGSDAVGAGLDGRAWRSMSVMFDLQKWDNSSRSFPRITLIEPSASVAPKWVITGDEDALIDIPGATLFSGENENKYNWDYVRMTWDFDANGGLGGYYEFQINHQVFDLRTLGGGSAAHPPQAGQPVDSYAGGNNIGWGIERSIKYPTRYPATLFVDDVVVTVGDVKA